MNYPNHISRELRKHFFGLRYLADPGSGNGKNSDPGWKKFGTGIRDKHPGSATLQGVQ
jgi:hypothetical protein